MNYIFNNCSSLLFLNLPNFNGDILDYRNDYIFSNIYSNFSYCIDKEEKLMINLLVSLPNAKRNCSSKCYSTPHKLNISSNKCEATNCGLNDNKIYQYNNSCYEKCPKRTRNSIENDYICESCLYYDSEQEECFFEIPKGFYLENENSKIIHKCPPNCSNCSYESMEYNLCEKCNIDEEYYPKLNDTLNIYPFINCYKGNIEGYYLDLDNNKIYKPCYSSCETCSGSGDENNHNCLTCKSGYTFDEFVLDDKNCYENCPFYYYFNSNNKYQCTLNDSCPRQYILIKNRSKCIDNCTKDDIYKYEYSSQCYEWCPENTKISEKDKYKCEEIVNTEEIEEISENSRDEAVNDFKDNLFGGKMNDTVSNLIKGNQTSIIMEDKEEGVTIEFTTTENKNNENNNRTTINLGECENKLKEQYNIDKNLPLLVLKIDVLTEGFLVPKIEYEVYHPISLEILNLSICEDTKIDLAIPVSINESNLYMYDSKSDFYNDICFTYTSKDGTDVSLKDRKKDFVDNNMTLCEENCEYMGYDTKTKKALCSCQIKIKLPLISAIYFDKEQLYKNFMNFKNILNLNLMKCHKVLFNKKGIKNNIGAWFVIPIIAIHIASIIIFYIKGFNTIKNKIKKIIDIKLSMINKANNKENLKNEKDKKNLNKNKVKKETNKKGKNQYSITENKDRDKKIGKNEDNKNFKKLERSQTKNKRVKSRKAKINTSLNIDLSEYNKFKKNAPPKKNKNKEKNNKIKIKNISVLKTNGEDIKDKNSSSIRKIKIKRQSLNLKGKEKIYTNKPNDEISKVKLNTQKNNLKYKLINLTDYELNVLDYKKALIIDKRTYFQFYISLIKTRHILIFTFFSYNDYNSVIIKISFFFFSIALFFTTNALFFNDSIIHRIKEDKGSFILDYQIPQIVYSSLISSVINTLMKSLYLTEKNIIEIKNFETKKAIKMKSKSVLNCIIKKSICYFALTFALLIFFWYYLSCFCAVYKNTQLHLMKDTLISYGLSMMYPFAIYLVPGIFRIPALRTHKKDKEILYKFSKLLQLI